MCYTLLKGGFTSQPANEAVLGSYTIVLPFIVVCHQNVSFQG